MAEAARDLFGSTSIQGCIPSGGDCVERAAGPVFSEDGRLIVSESFTKLVPLAEAQQTLEGFADEWLIEAWRIWDCYENDWAPCDIVVYRFENADVAVRSAGSEGACVWTGALDTHARVVSSRDMQDCAQKCWQWLRDTSASLPRL